MTDRDKLNRIAQIIENVDNRCMAADGPVNTTLHEMRQSEISEIYKLTSKQLEMILLSWCPECKKAFPEHLINPMYVTHCPGIENGYHLLCPLCALKVRNIKCVTLNKYWEEATEYARENH